MIRNLASLGGHVILLFAGLCLVLSLAAAALLLVTWGIFLIEDLLR